MKYLKTIKNNKKPFLRSLYRIVASDVKTVTGANIRKILLDTNLDPRMAPKSSLGNWAVYEPSGQAPFWCPCYR